MHGPRPLAGMRALGLAVVLSVLLGAGGSRPPPLPRWALGLGPEFRSSWKLAQKLLVETRELTRGFVLQHLPGVQLQLLPLSEQLLPGSLHTRDWLGLTALARLQGLGAALPQCRGALARLGLPGVDPKFAQRLQDVDWDLRDLAHHVTYQLSVAGAPTAPPPRPPPPAPRAVWRRLQATAVTLRSLEAVLARAARDFALLQRLVPAPL